MRARLFTAVLLIAGPAAHAATAEHELTVTIRQRTVLTARIDAQCDACDWGTAAREAVTLAVSLDGKYSQHLPLVRSNRAEYHIMLGLVEAGTHVVRVAVDPEQTSPGLRDPGTATFRIEGVADTYDENHPAFHAMSLAPILYARPNTIGRFSDVPVFMWYEIEPVGLGTRYRYSVVFTNEDGGTPADRLMATWGRTTDIEYIYSVVVDRNGKILADEYQGPEHKILRFQGRREGRQPLLWISTDNNMVRDSGEARIRYALVPQNAQLRDVSREVVMDRNRWLYALMSQELAREGKIVAGALPGKGTIPDPRRFVYVEACADVGTAALAFAVRAYSSWFPSDRDIPEYRIVRNGCFRVAIPLPAPLSDRDVTALRAQAFERPRRDGSPAPPPTPVRLTRINQIFMLDESYLPRRSRLQWKGERTLAAGGPPAEFPIP